jgi:MFS family permease
MGLYDSAFAALTWLYGREARSSITGITLIAGSASTIGWPLSAFLLHELDWRAARRVWAGLNVLLAAPVELVDDTASRHFAHPATRRE